VTLKSVKVKASKVGKGDVCKTSPEDPALLTVSHKPLLDGGSDKRFRQLVSDLLTLSVRMEMVREHLGQQMGITGPQYSVLVAVSHLQGEVGVSVGALARGLHVSSAFVATETRKLAQAGLVVKLPNPEDRRGVLISLSRAGRAQIARLTPSIRAINDQFFGALGRGAFDAMANASAALVRSSARVVPRLMAPNQDASIRRLEAAE
jgi:MarR family transcriptional regulator, organic hydroperoxide resistance regulator